jgi:hypothetical protein
LALVEARGAAVVRRCFRSALPFPLGAYAARAILAFRRTAELAARAGLALRDQLRKQIWIQSCSRVARRFAFPVAAPALAGGARRRAPRTGVAARLGARLRTALPASSRTEAAFAFIDAHRRAGAARSANYGRRKRTANGRAAHAARAAASACRTTRSWRSCRAARATHATSRCRTSGAARAAARRGFLRLTAAGEHCDQTP